MAKWIERQRHLIDFTLSSLLRRKRKNAVLVLVYTLIVFMLASVIFFVQSIKTEAGIILKNSPDIIIQRMSAGRHQTIPVAYADKIRSIRGVSAIKARHWGYYYDPVVGANYTIMAPDHPDAPAEGIIVGAGVARVRLISQGDTVEFRTYDGKVIDLTVSGTISPESEIVSSDLVLVGKDNFRRLFGSPDTYATDLVVTVTNPKEIPTVAIKIAELLPDTRQILKEEILRTYDAIFNWRGGMMVVILTGSMLAFIILAWDKASGLSSEERREIGVLKAVGWETSEVLLLKFWEGFAISMAALLSGVLLAYVHVFFTSSILFESALKGWAVLYPQYKLLPFIDPFQMTALFVLTVIPYSVATIIPAWRAATIDPDIVMR